MRSRQISFITAALFFSGFSGFSLEILFIRKLRLILGATSYAFVLTLAAVFTGFSLGSYYCGKKSRGLKKPAVACGIVQGGSALFVLAALGAVGAVGELQFLADMLFEHNPWKFRLIIIFGLAVVLLPWSFCWGGVLPVAVDSLRPGGKSREVPVTLLYAMTLAGGCMGIVLVLFGLLPEYGFFRSFLICMGVGVVAGVFFFFSGKQRDNFGFKNGCGNTSLDEPGRSNLTLLMTAFVSGFGTLGLELLWVRMFSLVDRNSTYTVATVLVLYSAALTIGSFLVFAILRKKWQITTLLFWTLIGSGLIVFLSPFVFTIVTEGILPLPDKESWLGYLCNQFGTALAVVLFPSIVAGMVFPLLMSASCGKEYQGRSIGSLLAVNTIGIILGAIFFGFFADQILGLWKSLWVIALLYCLAALTYSAKKRFQRIWWALIPIVCIVLCFFFIRLPLMEKNIIVRGMKVLEAVESSGSAVAVVGDERRMHLIINNQYSLGSNSRIAFKQSQALLPLLLHEEPKKVCFIGMGTGITAGAALRLPVEEVTVCEIVPGVVSLAKKYFQEYTGGLFSDPRVRIRPGDGRNYLTWTKKKFDVIVADLFIPWRSGTGTLYTSEYFSIIRSRLNTGGLFAHWLPLFQLSEKDLGTIVKTLESIFSIVAIWRLDFYILRSRSSP